MQGNMWSNYCLVYDTGNVILTLQLLLEYKSKAIKKVNLGGISWHLGVYACFFGPPPPPRGNQQYTVHWVVYQVTATGIELSQRF